MGCLLVTTLTITACQNDHAVPANTLRVYGLTEQVNGKSYSDLDEITTRWIFPADFSKSPLDDETGARSAVSQQPLPDVFFLASNLSGESTRTLTIPAGRPVYFQIVGTVNFYFDNDPCNPTYKPAPGQSIADFLLADIEPGMNTVKNLTAQLDGKDLVADLINYKVKSKVFTFVPPKAFTDPNCDYTGKTVTALTVTYALLVNIPKGKHVLSYRADLPDFSNFHTGVTWNLTVE